MCGCARAYGQHRPRRRDSGVDAALAPPTHGSIATAELQRVLAGEREAIRNCYASVQRADPLVQGGVELRLRIEEDGRVSQSAVSADGASLRRVAECIRRRLVARVFPRPSGGAATVVLPIGLAPEG